MKAFEKVIGYENEKKELLRIADALKNPEQYKKLGAKPPKGLLLNGNPGMGKTLMVNALIEESGRKSYLCRKDKPNGSFVTHITETFELAKQNAPSIVFLDDMDKFANEDEKHTNAEEYVTIQSCIDGIADSDVFVVATANTLRTLPFSLIRSGRFDHIITITSPRFADALKIIKYYLKDKEIMSDVDPDYIAKLMYRSSCATIESIINQAANIAAFERSDKIQLSHFIEAASKKVFHNSGFEPYDGEIDLSDTNSLLSEIVYHEAGHAVIHEIISPECVTLVSVCESSGYTAFFDQLAEDDVRHMEFDTLTSLGGVAAIEQIYGRRGLGGGFDLRDARWNTNKLMREYGKFGFNFTEHDTCNNSGALYEKIEIASDSIFEMYYEKAKKIIALNREFLEKIAHELAEKKVLTMYDIQRIKSECKIRKVDVL